MQPTRAKLYALRNWPAYLALLSLARILNLLPLAWAVEGAATIWRVLGPWLRQHRRAVRNLAIAFPELSERERERIARQMWANMGRVMAETMLIERILQEPVRAGPLYRCDLAYGQLGAGDLAAAPLWTPTRRRL